MSEIKRKIKNKIQGNVGTIKIKGSVLQVMLIAFFLSLPAACQPASTPTPMTNIQITSINEGQLTTGKLTQTKTFNQCDSSSAFTTQVEFSDSDTQTTQRQLVLTESGSAGLELESIAKAQISASIEEHFSQSNQQQQINNEAASIEVPAHTQQEYTIIWEETRRTGTVNYTENGTAKSADYSYRVGLELISATGRDIVCPKQGTSTPIIASSPTTTVSAIPVILSTKTERNLTANGLVIYTYIRFRDADGDSSYVTYEVVSSTISGVEIKSDPIKISRDNQIAGAIQTVSWKCLGKGYIVTLNARILDKAGNLSDPFPLTFDCRQW